MCCCSCLCGCILVVVAVHLLLMLLYGCGGGRLGWTLCSGWGNRGELFVQVGGTEVDCLYKIGDGS